MKRNQSDLQELVLKGDTLTWAKWGHWSDDGALWSPRQGIAMVTDGIGGLQIGPEDRAGDGVNDILAFQDQLKQHRELTRNRVREIFFSMAGQHRESAVVLLFCMKFLHEKALILQAGDCAVVRVNRLSRERTLEVLAAPQNVWEEHFRTVVFPSLDEAKKPEDLRRYNSHAIKTLLEGFLQYAEHLPNGEVLKKMMMRLSFWMDSEYEDRHRKSLWDVIQSLRSRYTASWRSSSEKLKEKIGDGKLVQLRKGDRILLCTDGIYPGVVSDEEVTNTLLNVPQRNAAAKRLIQYANRPGRKNDDRGIVIVDVDAKPYRKK